MGCLRLAQNGPYCARMGWSSHRTSEMPTVPPPIGRHRKQRIGRLSIGIAVVLACLAAAGIIILPQLLAGPPIGESANQPPISSTVDSSPPGRRAGTPTPTPGKPTPTTAPAPRRTSAAPPPASPMASFEDTVLRLVNKERAKQDCPALRNDANLHDAARAHSLDMARYGYHSHTGRDGSDPGERMQEAGYDVRGGWAENIARGYPTPAAVMAGWMGSSGHRKNILNCGLRAIGVGAARAVNGELYWTQDFGGR